MLSNAKHKRNKSIKEGKKDYGMRNKIYALQNICAHIEEKRTRRLLQQYRHKKCP